MAAGGRVLSPISLAGSRGAMCKRSKVRDATVEEHDIYFIKLIEIYIKYLYIINFIVNFIFQLFIQNST